MAKVNLLGSWAFLIGVIIAILVGLGVWVPTLTSTVVAVLVLLGLIIGLLTIGAKEVEPFVMASIAFLLAAFIGHDVLAKVTLVNLAGVLDAIIALVVPALVVVALKEVFEIAKK